MKWLVTFLALFGPRTPVRATHNIRATGLNIRNYGPIGKEIGGGFHGSVFRLNNHPNLVVKIMPITWNARKEYNIQKQLGNIGVAPRVHSFHNINVNGRRYPAIVMNRLGANGDSYMILANYMNKYGLSKTNFNIIKNTYNIMHGAGVGHGNIHEYNIAVILNKNGKVKGVKFIDFGLSRRTGNKHSKITFNQNREGLANLEALIGKPPGRRISYALGP